MKSKFLTALGIAAGIVVAGATLSDANADRRERGYERGWHGGHDRHIERRHNRRQRTHSSFHGRYNFNAGCHRFRTKAHRTGDPYWWGMYNRCRRAAH